MISQVIKLKDRIRTILINNLNVNFYIRLAKTYNDIVATFREGKNKRIPGQTVVECDYPLVYISQPPRCGGTITRNLMDGHDMLHVYPYELSWEKNGYHWEERLEINNNTLKILKDKWLSHAINYGFDRQIPFDFNRKIQRKIFLDQLSNSSRQTLGAYFTSFFNAYANYANLGGNKKYCVAFCPWTTIDFTSVERFFSIYPDGYRIHIIRNPFAWWASEKSYDKRKKDIDDYLEPHWIKSTNVGMSLSIKFPGRYLLLNYEALIRDTEKSMKLLCEALGIQFTTKLLTPMLNGQNRASNTSHGRPRTKIDSSSLEKWRKVLNDHEVELISENAEVLYNSALKKCFNYS